MVRQRQRKTIEEVYGSKTEGNKTQVNGVHNIAATGNNAIPKSSRLDRAGYPYTVPPNTAYISNVAQNVVSSNANTIPATNNVCNPGINTSRRRSSRPPIKSEKYYSKDDKLPVTDNAKKEHSTKARISRTEKSFFNIANPYDNKTYSGFNERNRDTHASGDPGAYHSSYQHQHHHHSHQHRNANHDDDKDDDTEEFFDLIRQTVESAIGKSISELLNRNFRELSGKIERFSSELKNTNVLLGNIQTELNNKVVHYGEENSRHFRYLCMKSEYDKMFYQHQSMLAATTPDSRTPQKLSSGTNANCELPQPENKKCNLAGSCTCRGHRKTCSNEPHKSSSDEHNISQKSSEMGMREVLEHIQKFCTQMQSSENKSDMTTTILPAKRAGYRHEGALKVNKKIFEEDDDDLDISSDGMTPRSDEHQLPKYGGTTVRSCNTSRECAGGGDA